MLIKGRLKPPFNICLIFCIYIRILTKIKKVVTIVSYKLLWKGIRK